MEDFNSLWFWLLRGSPFTYPVVVIGLGKNLLFKFVLAHCEVRNGNLLKSRVSEICVKRIRVNQGVGVYPNSWQYPLKNALIEPIGIAHIHSRTYTQLLWLNWCWYRLSKFSDVLSLACVLYTGLYLLLQPCNLATIFYNAQPNTYVGYV